MRSIAACLLLTVLLSGAAPKKRKLKPPPPANNATLEERITRILAAPAAQNAFWGIEVRDLKDDKVLYSQNADHFFVPASNTKLFTTALALARLGPDYRFHTRVVLDDRDLVLVGVGDPNLSGRTLPYEPDLPDPAPLAAINQMADEIAAKGIRRIPGNIVGDDTVFLYEPYPPGWGLADTYGEDGAPVSALSVDDNVARLQVAPALADGALADITWLLPFELFHIDNALLTDSATHASIQYQRLPGSHEIRVWGTVPPGRDPEPLDVAVDDPAQFAALALKNALAQRGVVCDGMAIARHRLPGAPPLDPITGNPITERISQPLLEAARIVDKVSQNLHAEMLLRDVALRLTGEGTREGGLDALSEFLANAGITADEYHFSDGSGLSRHDMVTPHAIASLLEYMAASPLREQWLGLLPVGGVDGSLRHRFHALRLRGDIRAKTGSLTHVSALSGYGVRQDGTMLVFSIVVNNYGAPVEAIHKVIDQISAALL